MVLCLSLSRLSLFVIGFTHCVNAFGFLDVHALLRNMEKVFAILSSLGLTAQLEMSCVSANAAVKFLLFL